MAIDSLLATPTHPSALPPHLRDPEREVLSRLTVQAFDLDGLDPFSSGGLDAAERRRGAMIGVPRARGRFLAGRAAQRKFAARLLALEEDQLRVNYICRLCGPRPETDHGMPCYWVAGRPTPLLLSLSRCGGWAVLAGIVNPEPGERLGIDVENLVAVGFAGFDDVALTHRERLYVAGVCADLRQHVRAQLWSRKEALLKAVGSGLTTRPDTVDLLDDPRVADLSPQTLGLPEHLVAAVARFVVPV